MTVHGTSLPTDDDSGDPAARVERLTNEGLIGMRAAASLHGRGREGVKTHSSTPTRHALKGILRPDGTVLRLEAIRIAGRLMTSRQAVLRFFGAQNGPAVTSNDPTPESPHQRARKQAAASAKLDARLGTFREAKRA